MTQFSPEIFTKKFFFLLGLGPSRLRQKGVAGGAEGVWPVFIIYTKKNPKGFTLNGWGYSFCLKWLSAYSGHPSSP